MSDERELREVDFPPKDEPLRRDVRLLGDLVGSVLREQGGESLFECVEGARHSAIRRREGVDGGAEELERILAELDAAEAEEIVRAFSTYFQVVNLAERVHRIRRGRDRMREGREPREGSLADTVGRLAEADVPGERILELFASSRVEPVFTAHPTESTRRVILDKQERVSAKSGHKFAFLQLSDATGVYEVMIFSDTLAKCRNFLEPGTALLVSADGETRDDEVRLTGQRIEPLESTLAHKIRELKIHIDASKPVERMHDILQHAGQGPVKVTLFAQLKDGYVAEFDLKGRYTIPSDMMSVLQKTPGFVKYSES